MSDQFYFRLDRRMRTNQARQMQKWAKSNRNRQRLETILFFLQESVEAEEEAIMWEMAVEELESLRVSKYQKVYLKDSKHALHSLRHPEEYDESMALTRLRKYLAR